MSTGGSNSMNMNLAERSTGTGDLVARLQAVLPPGRVLTDPGSLDAYSHDAWPVSVLKYQQHIHDTRPDVVVMASTRREVLEVLEVARAAGVPLVARGLGSSVTGQALPVQGGIVLDLTLLVGTPDLDPLNLTVTAPAGVRGSDLEQWLNDRGFTANFFPQSLDRSSLGGWIATRATGQLSSRYGGIEEAVVGYTVVLSDGSLVPVGQRPRAAVGPDIKHLFLGSEGTFGVVLDVTLKVYYAAPLQISEAWRLPSVEAGISCLRQIFQAGIRPSLMRLYDNAEARHALQDPQALGSAIFLTHEGLASIAEAEHAESRRLVESLGGVSLGSQPVDRWYARRFDFSGVETLLTSDGGYAETIEVAHLWSGIEQLYHHLTDRLAPLADEVLGHFSHVYTQGTSLYVIVLGRASNNAEASRRLDEVWRVAMETTIEFGGEISHHHGAGLARQAFIKMSLGAQHGVIQRMKECLDPAGILNPGHLGFVSTPHGQPRE